MSGRQWQIAPGVYITELSSREWQAAPGAYFADSTEQTFSATAALETGGISVAGNATSENLIIVLTRYFTPLQLFQNTI